MNYYLIITALTVSIDSFLCGFSLAMKNSKKFTLVGIITLIVFIMCLITNFGTILLKNILTEKTACLGGVVLIIIGFYNLCKKDKNKEISNGNFLTQSISAGFAVGLDGAFANLSLSLMGMNAITVPITIAFFHGGMLFLSVILANTQLAKKINKVSFIAPLILICLGFYKTIGLFI
jgi:putative Mn2+ efflux pump MntP